MQQLLRAAPNMRTAVQPLQKLPSVLHASAINQGRLTPDIAQQTALPVLDALVEALPSYEESMQTHVDSLTQSEIARKAAIEKERHARGLNAAWRNISRTLRGFSKHLPPEGLPNHYYGLPEAAPAPTPPKGAYLYGDVGCGKSMLMDMTFACASGAIRSHARVHYHAFMTSVYQMIHRYDLMSLEERVRNNMFHPLDAVVGRLGRANEAASGAGLLCFDEFQVADVADARLMHGILSRLMISGTIVCFTANRAPSDLNRSQLQDSDFIPFLDLIHERCDLLNLKDGIDHRARLSDEDNKQIQCYFQPDDQNGIEQAWKNITGHDWNDVILRVLPVAYGRELVVERAASNKQAVQMTVEQILEAPVGANDFRALANAAPCIFISNVIPIFTSDTRNLARRFITLIDVCYEEKVRIFMRTDATDLDDMFSRVETGREAAEIAEGLQFETEVAKQGVGADNRQVSSSTLYTGEDEAFAFRRAISRLKEMQTTAYGKNSVIMW